MRKNVVIKKDDYERYRIPISIPNLFPKKKNSYLWEELEKRHPCFSNEFCYSSKNCISKKGLFSDVVVMEKAKLAEYKNQCAFSHSLTLEDCGKRNVFENKYLWLFYMILFLVLSGLLITSLYFFIYHKKTVNEKNIGIVKNPIAVMEEQQNIKNYKFYDRNIPGIIFDIAKKHNGKITSMNWSVTDLGEKISCSLNNIYPEQLEAVFPDLKLSVVKYIDHIPVININFVNNFSIDQASLQNVNIDFSKKEKIRQFLRNNEIEMIEESAFPYEIVFHRKIFKNNNDQFLSYFEDLLNSLCLYTVGLSVTSVSNTEKYQDVCFRITFSGLKVYENNILHLINRNIDLFLSKQIKENVSNKTKTDNIFRKQNVKHTENTVPDNGVKVGEIDYANGKKILFYKNNNGKIIKKEVFNENKM